MHKLFSDLKVVKYSTKIVIIVVELSSSADPQVCLEYK